MSSSPPFSVKVGRMNALTPKGTPHSQPMPASSDERNRTNLKHTHRNGAASVVEGFLSGKIDEDDPRFLLIDLPMFVHDHPLLLKFPDKVSKHPEHCSKVTLPSWPLCSPN